MHIIDNALHPFPSHAGECGAARATGKAEHSGRFRTPGLRNVALTAPYLHDGSAPSVGAAIARHGSALGERELADLGAFLAQLTDRSLTTDARFVRPPLRRRPMR